MDTLGVGIIGASADRGWARISHVPALQALQGLRIAAVGGNSAASVQAAAWAFGVERAYDNTADLVRDPAVDIVAIAVRVPAHRALALQALAAGKHVYCEWPLGRDVAEAEELARAAQAAGLHAAIGLQARVNPALRRAREILSAGGIGRVLSAQINSETIAFGQQTDPAETYLEDRANGATLVTIHAGHAIDAAAALLGRFTDIQALATTQFPQVEVAGQPNPITRTIPDHVFMQSRLSQDGTVAIEVAGGRDADAGFRCLVTGTTGKLVLQGAAPRGFQSGRLTLTLNGAAQPIDEGELSALPDAAFNVGAAYAALRDDINGGTFTLVDFEHAVRLSRLLADLEASASSGQRHEIGANADEA